MKKLIALSVLFFAFVSFAYADFDRINNRETGAVVRDKLNTMLEELYDLIGVQQPTTSVTFNSDDVAADVLTISYTDQSTTDLAFEFFDPDGIPITAPTILTISSTEITADVEYWPISSEDWTVIVVRLSN